MKERRLKPGEYIAMSDEEKIAWRRILQKRWRHNHPEWVKNSNKKWSKTYKETKPFECICVQCGIKFGAARNHLKLCPQCWAGRQKHAQQLRDEFVARNIAKKEFAKTVLALRKKGLTSSYFRA